MVKIRNLNKPKTEKCEGKTPLGKYRRRWEDNIETDL